MVSGSLVIDTVNRYTFVETGFFFFFFLIRLKIDEKMESGACRIQRRLLYNDAQLNQCDLIFSSGNF